MKKLNLFAFGIVAMLVAMTGVVAADNEKILTDAALKTCLEQEGEATCKVLATDSTKIAATAVVGKIHLVLDLDGSDKIQTTGAITVKEGASLTIEGKGTIERDTNADRQVIVVEKGTLSVDGVTLKSDNAASPTAGNKSVIAVKGGTVTLGSKSVVDGYAGVIAYPVAYPTAGTAEVTTLNLNGTIKAKQYAVQVNGKVTEGTVKVNVNAGTYTSSASAALYAAGVADWTIAKDVEVTGAEAVLALAGTMNINGGKFTATATTGSGSGENVRAGAGAGSAVVVLKKTGYAGDTKDITLNVADGEFAADHGNALYLDGDTVVPSVEGGTFVAKDTSNSYPIKVANLKGANKYFIEGGSFNGKADDGSFTLDDYLVEDLASGKDAEGNSVVGTPHTVTLNVKLANGVEVAYTVPEKEFEAVKGQNINLLKLVGLDTKSPEDRAKRYAVKYTVSNGTTGLDEFTMVGEDVTIEAEIVVVSAKTQPSENIPTTPGTEPGTQEPGTDPGTTPGTEPGTTTPSDDEENPNTLDNVTSVAAMGGISLAIAAAGIATLKKREN